MKRLFVLLFVFLIACTSTQKNVQYLRLNLASEPPTLDPRKATDATSVNVLLALFEGLTRVGFDNKPDLALADSIEVSKDGLTYTMHLRDAKWNNGDKLTSYDFLKTWQQILNPSYPAPYAYKLFVIKNAAAIKEGKLPVEKLAVTAPDAHSLIITLEHPTPYFLELLAFPTFFAVNQKSAAANDDWAADAGPQYVSNGPFNLQKWEHDSEINLVKNPLYWDRENVCLETINMSMIDDSTTEFNMFESNELDWAGSPLSNLPTDILPAIRAEGILHTYPIAGGYYYRINTTCFPLSNVHIRQALSYAINRQEIITHILQGGEKPALALVPAVSDNSPHDFFHDGDTKLAQERFKQGLAELGIEKLPKLHLSYNTNREHQKIAQAIQQQWRETLGVETELDHVDWKVYLAKIAAMDYEISRMGWLEDYDDPLSFLESFRYNDEGPYGNNNNTGWTDPTYSELLTKAEYELNTQKRLRYLLEAESIIMEAMPVIPIYFLTFKYVKKPYVKCVYLNPNGTVDYKWTYIEK